MGVSPRMIAERVSQVGWTEWQACMEAYKDTSVNNTTWSLQNSLG